MHNGPNSTQWICHLYNILPVFPDIVPVVMPWMISLEGTCQSLRWRYKVCCRHDCLWGHFLELHDLISCDLPGTVLSTLRYFLALFSQLVHAYGPQPWPGNRFKTLLEWLVLCWKDCLCVFLENVTTYKVIYGALKVIINMLLCWPILEIKRLGECKTGPITT